MEVLNLFSPDSYSIYCSDVTFAPGHVYVSECESNSVKVTQSDSTQSDDCSGGAMGEEDIEAVKFEFRLGMEYLFCIALIHTKMRKGKCDLVRFLQ